MVWRLMPISNGDRPQLMDRSPAWLILGTGLVRLTSKRRLTGLSVCSTYHYRVFGTNSDGSASGGDQSFTTAGCAPDVETALVTSVTSGEATLNGVVDPSGQITTVYFEWGEAETFLNTTSPEIVSETGPGSFSAPLTGLEGCTTYNYRAVASNASGMDTGDHASFSTSGCLPGATTLPASLIDADTATLNGQVDPNGLLTEGAFEWGPTTGYGNTTTLQDLGSGSGVV